MPRKQPPRETQRLWCRTCNRWIGLITTENGKTTYPEFTREDAGECPGCLARARMIAEGVGVEAEV